MDFMTIVGIFIGLSAVGWELEHNNMLGLILNLNAIILIYGGTIGSVCISYSWSVVKNIPQGLMWMFVPPKYPEPQAVIETLVTLSKQAQTVGPEALLEQLAGTSPHPLLEEGLKMLSDGLNHETVREKLEQDIALTHQRHMQLSTLFNSAGTYSPIFGLLGTLLGVVTVLRNISDPTQMGTAMAMAMTASFYGIFSANFLFLPVSVKLRSLADQETLMRELISQGVQSIMANDVPYVTSKKLENFLSHRLRRQHRRGIRTEVTA